MTDALRKKLDLALEKVDITPADVDWTTARVEALMAIGMLREMALTVASAECIDRIKDRTILRVLDEEDAAADRRKAQSASRQQEARAGLQAKAVEGQRPTLKTSLGDLLAARGKKSG